jgi:hypothetical protein
MEINPYMLGWVVVLFVATITFIIKSNKNSDKTNDQLTLIERQYGIKPTIFERNDIQSFIDKNLRNKVSPQRELDLDLLKASGFDIPNDAYKSNVFAEHYVNENYAGLVDIKARMELDKLLTKHSNN